MDEFDRASEAEQIDRDLCIAQARRYGGALLPVGACHYCDSLLRADKLFCDAECRDEWERERIARIRNGR